MCPITRTADAVPANPASAGKGCGSTCFTCTRLNATTFLIVEEDKWDEVPFIYIKIYESRLVLVDTGCGGAAKNEAAQLTSLRDFIETCPVDDNDNRALNPGGQKSYVVLCSHCHFDHIGGIAQFSDAPGSSIWASSYDKNFIEGDDRLPTTSLCRFFAMETPTYRVTNWADDGQHVVVSEDGKDVDLGLVIYHTPGHTPDEIAVWDPQERVIFVGDTMYEWAHIVFPLEGNLKLYSETMCKLKTLVREWNAEPPAPSTATQPRVKIACGHISSASDAEQLIGDVDLFLYHVAEGIIEPREQGTFRDEPLMSYDRDDGKISFVGPKRLLDEFRTDAWAMEGIRARHM